MYAFFHLSLSDLLSCIISNTNKHKFSSILKRIRCSNDVMNHIGCVMKRDVYPQKMRSCSKKSVVNLFFFFYNVLGISRKKYIIGVIVS